MCPKKLAVGYKDKLVLYHILVDGLKAYREMQCQSIVRIIEFSSGGQFLSVVVNNTISVYATYQSSHTSTFLLVSSFTSHVGRINHLTWANNTLFSAGTDRNIYGWDMNHGARIDNMNKLRSFGACTSIVVSSSHKSFKAAACTSEGSLHKLTWSGRASDESELVTISGPSDDGVTVVCLCHDKGFLYAGTVSGKVRVYDWHSSDDKGSHCISQISLHCHYPPSANNLPANTHSISCLKATRTQLVSAGCFDGAIFLSKLKGSQIQDKQGTHNIGTPFLTDDIVLISMEEHNESKAIIADLEERIKTLKIDHNFNIHSKETLSKNELLELTTKTDDAIEAER